MYMYMYIIIGPYMYIHPVSAWDFRKASYMYMYMYMKGNLLVSTSVKGMFLDYVYPEGVPPLEHRGLAYIYIALPCLIFIYIHSSYMHVVPQVASS